MFQRYRDKSSAPESPDEEDHGEEHEGPDGHAHHRRIRIDPSLRENSHGNLGEVVIPDSRGRCIEWCLVDTARSKRSGAGMALRIVTLRPEQRLKVKNDTRGTLVVEELWLALAPWRRLRGLILRPALRPKQGMLIRPCPGVHTCFMTYAIDVLFLDPEGVVVAARRDLKPFRFTPIYPCAAGALELRSGQAAVSRTEVGDRLSFEAVEMESTPSTDI